MRRSILNFRFHAKLPIQIDIFSAQQDRGMNYLIMIAVTPPPAEERIVATADLNPQPHDPKQLLFAW